MSQTSVSLYAVFKHNQFKIYSFMQKICNSDHFSRRKIVNKQAHIFLRDMLPSDI